MQWNAYWIWTPGDVNPINHWLCARKKFNLQEIPRNPKLAITADTRYVLWVNGKWIGEGPVRAWNWNWRYDIHPMEGLLRTGENVIAILALHYGVGTFQSLPTRGGILAQLDSEDGTLLVSDSTWKLQEHPGFRRNSPRICSMQGWSEIYDSEAATREFSRHQQPQLIFRDDAWLHADYDDSHWQNSEVIGEPGCEPWTNLSPRDIPFLTHEVVYPMSVLRARIVHPPDAIWSVNLRTNLLPGYRDANPRGLCGFLVTKIKLSQKTDVSLLSVGAWMNIVGKPRVNGKDAENHWFDGPPWDNGNIFRFSMDAGENLLVFRMTENAHEWHCLWGLETNACVEDISSLQNPKWYTIGPFDSEDDPSFQQIWNATTWLNLERQPHSIDPVNWMDIHESPFLDTAYARHTRDIVHTTYEQICIPNQDWVTIPSSHDGDTEILLDFGRMMVGFVEFELDAPENTIVDITLFEAIQDGVNAFPFGIENAFRYITRKGVQRYRSIIRRGGRYALLTIRNHRESVVIHWVRQYLNTYPVTERGDFQCSDSELNAIWEMGKWSARLCSEDTYVDCPTYEQTFWVGDSRAEALISHFTFGDYALTRRSLLLAAESLVRSPLVESQVPSAWFMILPVWSLLWSVACDEYIWASGDMNFISEIYPYLEKQTLFLESHVNEHGLLLLDESCWKSEKAGLGEHIPQANLQYQIWFIRALASQIHLAELRGENIDHISELRNLMCRLQRTVRERFYDPHNQLFASGLDGQGIPNAKFNRVLQALVFLFADLEKDKRESLSPAIRMDHKDIDPPHTPFEYMFLFEALADAGEYGAIFEYMHSIWGYMLRNGATTCWETMPGGWQGGRWTRSHCHAWSGAPTWFLSRYVLGVEALTPGYQEVRIEPVLEHLAWAKGKAPTPTGEVEVEWSIEGALFQIRVSLPAESKGTLILPASMMPVVTKALGCVKTDAPWIFKIPYGGEAVITANLKH